MKTCFLCSGKLNVNKIYQINNRFYCSDKCFSLHVKDSWKNNIINKFNKLKV